MKLKEGELNTYWREAKRRQYMNVPEWQAKKALRTFLTKKEALTEGEDMKEALEETLCKIRAILTGESVDELEAHRRSR